jgi:hypothetical protein
MKLPIEAQMKIELLYFDGCPNYRPALDRLRSVLRQEGLSADISEIEVRDESDARAFEFIGSPTIRIDGRDIDRDSRDVKAPAFACRRYEGGGGSPSEEMIRHALKEAQKAVQGG